MAYWGIALANGPHINNPLVPPERAKAAWEALAKAREHAKGGTDVEQALIEALAKRYADPQPEDRRPLDEAYAAAMREVCKQFPKDADVGALFAESLMDLRPWDLWTADGKPQPGTPEIVATLEAVLKHRPTTRSRCTSTSTPSRRRRSPARRPRPPTGCASCTRPGAPGPHAVAHRPAPRPVAAGDRGERAGDRGRRRSTGRRCPSRASTASTWPTTTTCWRSRP